MWGLEELPRPEAISWMPETYGWGLVALALLVGVAWIGLRRYRAWQRQAYRREAIEALDQMTKDQRALTDLPELLRRTALRGFPREEVAPLRGEAWVEWLNGEGASFLAEDAAWLDRLAYQSGLSEEIESDSAARLIAASLRFVRSHRARV